ncbi:hypothetical protein M408DRAFT_200063 [Serendipita vermifera MAFF 305830]|uniref:Secreted protein n=1 Tax=Serendipita vermifera MAFF 305830 TaxID=933852 RepID=A0A0C3AND5_SERVB|nr:hypothetical protein M408DRAFT_200063 [Serendipita vermifera MAFF 305830]
MFKFVATLFALALSVAALPAPADDSLPFEIVDGSIRWTSAPTLGINVPRAYVDAPQGFNITSIGVNGSGCPAGTARYALNAAKDALTVVYSNYYARDGPGIDIDENRRACQTTLGVRLPGGFAFGVASVDYTAYYALDAKVKATQNTIYYFQGQIAQSTASSTLVGPVAGARYTYHSEFDFASIVESPCGQTTVLNIVSSLIVNNDANPKGYGFIAAASSDTHLEQLFGLQWAKC